MTATSPMVLMLLCAALIVAVGTVLAVWRSSAPIASHRREESTEKDTGVSPPPKT